MPEQITKYNIFLASPSDLKEERECLDEVIKELNQTYASRNGIILELLKWETHSAPDINKQNLQSIINNDIGNNYDLFVGLLWHKFGTPTENYLSGTEEEFSLAYNRFIENQDSLKILVYFKTSTPKSLTDINPEELIKVQKFKENLGKEKGVLYREFETKDELQKLLRQHIPLRIDDLLRHKVTNETFPTINDNNDKIKVDESDELGILDYLEIMEDSFAQSNESLTEISEATNWIGVEMSKKTTELNAITASKQNIGKNEMRDFYRRTASVMNKYADRIETRIPHYIEYFEQGLDAYSKLLQLYTLSDQETYKQERQDAEITINELIISIEQTIISMTDFLISVKNLPRMEKELNQGRRAVEKKLEELIETLKSGKAKAINIQLELL